MNKSTPVQNKRFWTIERRHSAIGWLFLVPAVLLIVIFSFWPMVQAMLTSLKRGLPTALQYSDPLWRNYQRMLSDKVFLQSVTNTITYLIIQVPIMLVLAIIPIIGFYLVGQKYIISGVIAGAVKG